MEDWDRGSGACDYVNDLKAWIGRRVGRRRMCRVVRWTVRWRPTVRVLNGRGKIMRSRINVLCCPMRMARLKLRLGEGRGRWRNAYGTCGVRGCGVVWRTICQIGSYGL